MENNGNNLIHSFGSFSNEHGLTKREYFSGLAMQGLITTVEHSVSHINCSFYATKSVELADALLLALEAKTEDGK